MDIPRRNDPPDPSWGQKTARPATHILVWDNLDTNHVASCLEDLLENVLCHSGVETADVKSSLVGLRRSPADVAARTGGRHHAT